MANVLPTSEELVAEIKARAEELRAKRLLLKLARAAEVAHERETARKRLDDDCSTRTRRDIP
jgi:hypothetical protein